MLTVEHLRMIRQAFGFKGISSSRELADFIFEQGKAAYGIMTIAGAVEYACHYRKRFAPGTLPADYFEQVKIIFGTD